MRCDQIRQRLSESEPIDDPVIRAHVEDCPDCRRVWEAERLLRQQFDAVRAEPLPRAMGTARAWVDSVVTPEESTPMKSLIHHPFGSRSRRMAWTLTAVAAVLAFFVLVPFSYEHTVGTQLVITAGTENLPALDNDALQNRLAEHGLEAVQINSNFDGQQGTITYRVPGSRDDALAAFEATRDLLPSLGTEPQVAVQPWRVRESGSLFAQIASNVFTVSVNTEGKSESQIADEIKSQLAAQGMQVDNLWISKDPSGATTMTLEGGAPGASGDQKFEVRLFNEEEGGNTQEFSAKILLDDLDPNLTDAQKIEAIKQKLAEQGIFDADVKLDGDNVKIELKKEQ